jgi:hypothetical protein
VSSTQSCLTLTLLRLDLLGNTLNDGSAKTQMQLTKQSKLWRPFGSLRGRTSPRNFSSTTTAFSRRLERLLKKRLLVSFRLSRKFSRRRDNPERGLGLQLPRHTLRAGLRQPPDYPRYNQEPRVQTCPPSQSSKTKQSTNVMRGVSSHRLCSPLME